MNRFGARVGMVTWVLGFALLAAAMPGLPARTAAAQGIGQASYGGVSFAYDPSLATEVRGETIPGNVGSGAIVSEIRPAHIRFAFTGYPAAGGWTPQMRVIPRAAYAAAQAESSISGELAALAGYLGGDAGPRLPFLPAVNAQRIITEQVSPVAGGGITGVRFIASYAQGIIPVRPDNITYMFIGLTADRQYYVEGTFPVALATPLDPAPAPLTAANVAAYNQAVATRLGQTSPADFTPTLDKLDKLMGSLRVNSVVLPGMPVTGAAEPAGPVFGLLALGTLLILVGVAVSARARTGASHGQKFT